MNIQRYDKITVLLLLLYIAGLSVASQPTTLNVFDSNGMYYAFNMTNGEVIMKQQIPFPSKLSALYGIVRTRIGDDYLLYGGNITQAGQSYIPIIWTYNIQSNTLVEKSSINKRFEQLDYSWDLQIASYDSLNNIVYLNAEAPTGHPMLLKFDFNQHIEDLIELPGTGSYVQSSYNESTHTCYLGGQNDAPNSWGQMVIVTYESLTGDMTSRTLTLDTVSNQCYYRTTMYLYNSKYFAGLQPANGDCSSYILELDMFSNTTNILATIPQPNNYAYDDIMPFIFDEINGYITMVSFGQDGLNLEICSVNLDNYGVSQYSISASQLPDIQFYAFLMTTS
ncbi:hypothetical protein PPL_02044 [Heterostelium album PN500]|uniref:Uncharacterized protein n=1 Tax=Heterostelium pallidum (strain ATCC 26659 / Pp 5 / PN500) TaxID=670386 RepID=D3B174_HETP5|nr:hypothetical protein PPL_02044 [Heterostelium album PN500]EFA85048.1 hypothetical protein PPL_02044 [Heterostelium album PN500]|eukprot:XP_020437158.1 hypothetical protein PPL_02044 [Heterostelium album PN500]